MYSHEEPYKTWALSILSTIADWHWQAPNKQWQKADSYQTTRSTHVNECLEHAKYQDLLSAAAFFNNSYEQLRKSQDTKQLLDELALE